MSSTSATIPLAATLILLRDRGPGVEVLMIRRRSELAFLGGVWVFPGGRLDAADCSAAARARIPAEALSAVPAMRSIGGDALPPEVVLGLEFAACRETYEEVGLLLARHADGRPLAAHDAARVTARRPPVHDGASELFAAVLAAEDLVLELERLVYWSHWVTPSIERRRFDTRFFAIAVPGEQEPAADERESTELAWLSPHDVAAAAARGEMLLAPPTLFTLEDIDECNAAHGSVAAMLAAESRRPTPAIMPRVVSEGDTVSAVMPWDPGYAALAGEGSSSTGGFPAHFTRRRSRLTFQQIPLAR